MYRVAIVEDEAVYAQQLETLLRQYEKERGVAFQISAFADGFAIVRDYRPVWDIIFLDIRMQPMDGMEAARRIRERDGEVLLIFITSLAQYAVQSYEVDAQDFILKPVSYPQLRVRLDKALRLLEHSAQRFLVLPYGELKERVPVRDILFIEVRDHNLEVVTRDRVYSLRAPLQEMEKNLAGCHFSRCNHCYLVNLRNVTGFLKDSVLVGGHTLPVSRPKRKQFLRELSDYLGVTF